MSWPEKSVRDRRVQRTRRHLHDALFSLIHERDFDSIAVKEILHRADVGRSTFYAHFRDKEDLLVSAINDVLRSMRPAVLPASATPHATVIWFSLPIFEHIDQLRRAGPVAVSTRSRAIIHERLQEVLTTLIADRVRKYAPSPRQLAAPVPSELVARHVASTFIMVLNWWLENGTALDPKQVNDVFRALVLPALSATYV